MIRIVDLHKSFGSHHDLHSLLHFTAVVVSHEIPEVFSPATHIAMLNEGQVVATGTPEDLQASTDSVGCQFLNGETVRTD